MADIRIYKPSRNVMQSASLGDDVWHIAYNQMEPKSKDPIMGWTSSAESNTKKEMVFESLEKAKEYCEKKGLTYIVVQPQMRKVNIHPYAATLMKNPNL